MNHSRVVSAVFASLALAVAYAANAAAADANAPRVKRLTSTHTISDEATWQRLAARPAAWAVARTEVVKFLLDREDRRILWFTDTERYPFHYHFARDYLSSPGRPVEDHALFNAIEYHDANRRFEMGAIVHYLDGDLWTMELASSDPLPGENIVRLYTALRDALWIGDRLRFHPLSDLQERSVADVSDRLPVFTTSDVFGSTRYQPLTTGTTFGTLRFVTGELDLATVRADQILVLAQLPEEIPVNAGVISQDLQAPLGHIAILCATRGTPNMALRDAFAHPDLRVLDGRLIELTVGPQEFSVRAATSQEAEASWNKRRPRRPQVPQLDAEESRLLDVKELRLRDTRFAGAKAAQLGEVMRLKNVITPGGFVIPLSHYLAHVQACGATADLADRLADPAFAENSEVRAQWLEHVRTTIEQAPIDPGLVAQVRERIQALAPDSRWILRSSTNAEDLAGFTGAGLYRSLKIKPGASDADLANAIRGVWASVWLQGAFEERAWYRVDHSAVGMAILVQPFVDGAVANGVAITANPFAEMRPAFFVNAQALGGSVTGAAGNEIPEQHLIYTFIGDFESEILSRSSRTGGEPLLREADLRQLADILQRLHRHFLPKWRGPANAVDVEFLIAGEDRHVVILQARPYTVVYAQGQRDEDVPAEDTGSFPGLFRR